MVIRLFALIFILSGTLSAHSKIPFVLKRTDAKARMAEIAPMTMPLFFVSIESGVLEITHSEVIQCEIKARQRKVILEGKEMQMIETILACGDRVFVIKGVDFNAK